MDSGQRPVDNAWISPELHSRCPDFPAPSSSARVLTMPGGPSFAGKPALQLPGDQGHQLHLSILTMPRTQNSDNIKVPTPPRRRLFIVFYGPFSCWPSFLSRKTSLQKIPSGDTRPGLFDNRLDENLLKEEVCGPFSLAPESTTAKVSTSTSLCGTSTGPVSSFLVSYRFVPCPVDNRNLRREECDGQRHKQHNHTDGRQMVFVCVFLPFSVRLSTAGTTERLKSLSPSVLESSPFSIKFNIWMIPPTSPHGHGCSPVSPP